MEFRTVIWDGKKLNKDFIIHCKEGQAFVVVQFNVSKREVKRQDLSRLNVMLESVKEIGNLVRSSMLLCFDYDDDPRELSQIPEVTRYIRLVIERHGYLYYYLMSELNQHIFTSIVPHIMLSAPLAPPAQKVIQLDIPAANHQLSALIDAVMSYGRSIGDEKGARASIREWRQTLNL